MSTTGSDAPTPWVADFPASERYPIYTRANAGEVVPGPISPLSATIGILGPGEQGWRDAYVEGGSFFPDEFEIDRPNCMGVFGGYLFLNMSMTRIYGVRMPGMTPEQVDQQYFGDMPGITPYADEARPSDESAAATAQLQEYVQEVFTTEDLPELRADRAQVARLVAARPPLTDLPDQELVDHARSFMPLYRRLFCRHILVSGASGIGIGTVAGICAAIERPDLTMTLVSGLGDVDSAAPSWAMWELSRLDPSSQEYRAGLDDLLVRFGSRGPDEWDLISETWGTDPRLVEVAIRSMRAAPDAESPQVRTERRVTERVEATGAVRAALAGADDETRGQFEAGLRAAHLFSAGRERTKTNTIGIVHEMRLALREVAGRFVDRGVIDEHAAFFMLTERELDAAVDDPSAFSDVLRERHATYGELFDRVPPFVTHGAPDHWTTWSRRSDGAAEPVSTGDVLTGIPGCPGTVRGRARVVVDPGDPRGLEPGDILVAPLTDPAWTPLFVPAGGVVVDVGAQITHAVIVSRELGLPCVVSVIDASKRIPDGALIEVDGALGTVTVLELPGR